MKRALLLIALVACGKHDDKSVAKPAPAPTATAPEPPHGPEAVPKASTPFKIDAEWDEPDWTKHTLRHIFTDTSGQIARPYSEVRLIHDDHALYVGLYASDENIESNEYFDVKIGQLALRAYATGKIEPAIDGVSGAVDRDEGTIDNPKDDDEEWKLEIAIPLAKTGYVAGTPQTVRFARCDTPKDGIQRCGAWAGSITLQ